MNQFINITLLAMALTVLLIPFFLSLSLLFPTRLRKAQALMAQIPGRCFAIGAVNFVFLLILGLGLFSLSERAGGAGKVLLLLAACAIALLLAICISLGLSGMAGLIGERLAPDRQHWLQILGGTLLLGFGSALPLLGWFLLFPYAGWVGMGGVLLSWLQRKQ